MSKNIYDVFADTDWKLLREQKARLAALPMMMSEDQEAIDGILNWIDAIQDAAVDEGVVPASEVFEYDGGDSI